ncbi:lipocalin Cav p 3.0101-like [Arvicanthis niloticus]|uniref:lipocalin Cav p 3.0101-like n=1 Tax=Arvicanthis niloticus TaxID=61156 RepID=UPI00402B445E
MEALLLAVVFAWICFRSGSNEQLNETQISGDWHTIAIAATEIDVITDDGLMKLFFRHLECAKQCKEIILTFYGEVDEECEKFEVKAQNYYSDLFTFTYSGNNYFRISYVSSTSMTIFCYYSKDDFQYKHVFFLLGKGNSVREADQQTFTKACNMMKLPKENIRYLLEKDICPK